jgi:hypothetical protein
MNSENDRWVVFFAFTRTSNWCGDLCYCSRMMWGRWCYPIVNNGGQQSWKWPTVNNEFVAPLTPTVNNDPLLTMGWPLTLRHQPFFNNGPHSRNSLLTLLCQSIELPFIGQFYHHVICVVEFRCWPKWVNSVKMSQPIPDGFGANTDRFPKQTIESTLLGRFYDQNCGKS